MSNRELLLAAIFDYLELAKSLYGHGLWHAAFQTLSDASKVAPAVLAFRRRSGAMAGNILYRLHVKSDRPCGRSARLKADGEPS